MLPASSIDVGTSQLAGFALLQAENRELVLDLSPYAVFLCLAQSANCNLVCCCRWTDLENNPLMQQYANYGLGTAYGLIALVALVSRSLTPAPMHVAAPVSVSTNPVSYEGF